MRRFAHLVAMLVIAKGAYGDVFEIVRRREPMTIASELARSLAPPTVFATDDLSLGIMLEPCYDNGGDAVDYATDDRVLHVGIFDAMGHGLAAAGVAAFAVAAYRHSRRAGRDLMETHASMHDAVGRQFPEERFVTAIIARLELDSGRLTWINAGHPPPLILRGGRHPRLLESPATTPLGVALGGVATVTTAALEPGDLVLLYTDGLTDARDRDGELFRIDRLARFIEHEAAAGYPAPETLRRLRAGIVGRRRAELRDDASAVLFEWRRGTERQLLPQAAT
jgi:serine phosphatase RsbU (regulator of sigma subunit)